MTALTPQQMRELADVLAGYHSWKDVRNGSSALRAAADQLEAVQVWTREHYHHFQEISELDTILTADTAPQEDQP